MYMQSFVCLHALSYVAMSGVWHSTHLNPFSSRFGASIIVGSHALLSAITDVIFNPLCFALYENSSIPPIEWDDVSYNYNVKSDLFHTTIANCKWSDLLICPAGRHHL